METKQETPVKLIWMIRKYIPQVLAIEADSFDFP